MPPNHLNHRNASFVSQTKSTSLKSTKDDQQQVAAALLSWLYQQKGPETAKINDPKNSMIGSNTNQAENEGDEILVEEETLLEEIIDVDFSSEQDTPSPEASSEFSCEPNEAFCDSESKAEEDLVSENGDVDASPRKRKRGRPGQTGSAKKAQDFNQENNEETNEIMAGELTESGQQKKRGRGRPKGSKNMKPVMSSRSCTRSGRLRSRESAIVASVRSRQQLRSARSTSHEHAQDVVDEAAEETKPASPTFETVPSNAVQEPVQNPTQKSPLDPHAQQIMSALTPQQRIQLLIPYIALYQQQHQQQIRLAQKSGRPASAVPPVSLFLQQSEQNFLLQQQQKLLQQTLLEPFNTSMQISTPSTLSGSHGALPLYISSQRQAAASTSWIRPCSATFCDPFLFSGGEESVGELSDSDGTQSVEDTSLEESAKLSRQSSTESLSGIAASLSSTRPQSPVISQETEELCSGIAASSVWFSNGIGI